jgi:hypothetical protein
MVRKFTEAQLRGSLHFLLDFKWAGRTVHLAGRRLTAPIGEAGADVEYFPGLKWARSFDRRFGIGSSGASGTSAGLTLFLYPHVDVPAMMAAGHVLGSATARLMLWADGSNDTLTILDGAVRDPAWTSAEEPITGTLEVAPTVDAGLIPGPNARVKAPTGGATWTAFDLTIGGEYYPIVFGSPAGAKQRTRGSPALYVNHNPGSERVLIAGHHTHAGANSSKVFISNLSDGIGAEETAVNGYDDLGQPVTTADLSGWVAPPSDGDDLWCAWTSAAGVASYGMLADDGSAPMQGAGDVLQWMLRRSTVPHDTSRIAALAEYINTYTLATYAMAERGERVPPWHWIQDALLPLLPVSLHYGDRGLFLQPWRHTATAADAIADLNADAGGNSTRLSNVNSTPRDAVATTVEVSYDVDPRTNSPAESVTLSGDPAILDDVVEAVEDPWLTEAWRIYGTTKTEAKSARAVEDSGTAGRIASWVSRMHGPQRSIAVYQVDQYPGGLLDPGSVVTITDTVRGWASRPAIVHAAQWSDSGRVDIEIHVPAFPRGEAA